MRAIHLFPLLLFFVSFSDCYSSWGSDFYTPLGILCNGVDRDQLFSTLFEIIDGYRGPIKYTKDTFSQARLVYKCPHNHWESLESHLQTFRSAPAGSRVQMHLESLRVVNYNLIARLRFDGFGQTRKMVYDYELYIPQGYGWDLEFFWRNFRVLKIWTVC